MSRKVEARKVEMLRALAVGAIPHELAHDAMLMCEEPPPAWRVFARRRWDLAVKRVYAAMGLG